MPAGGARDPVEHAVDERGRLGGPEPLRELDRLVDHDLDRDVAVSFGVLTTDTIEQALERAGTKAGNKGFDAALAAIELATLYKALAGPVAKKPRSK